MFKTIKKFTVEKVVDMSVDRVFTCLVCFVSYEYIN